MRTLRLLFLALLAGCSTAVPVEPIVPVALPSPTRAVVLPTAAARPTAAAVASPAPLPSYGGDISWPSCPIGTPGALPKKQGKGLPLPGPGAQFVILGLTNGPGFHANPCLAWEVHRTRGLPTAAYAFLSLPTPAQITRYGGLRNAARAEAVLNVDTLRRSGLSTPIIWIDVEPQPYLAPWGKDIAANRVTILSAREAYREAGFATGFYSSDTPWKRITGGLRSTDPTWVTVGPRGRAAAVAKCSAQTFSGGPAVLAQWWDGPTEDLDLVCPSALRVVSSLFAHVSAAAVR